MKKIHLFLLFSSIVAFAVGAFVYHHSHKKMHTYDLTVVGYIKNADGLGRQSIDVIDLLKDDLKINFKPTNEEICLKEVPPRVQAIVQAPFEQPGKVALLESVIWGNPPWGQEQDNSLMVPDSKIKIAYTMFEASSIPSKWVPILNERFDAIAVPDPFLVDVYQKSGVTIPIFVLPLGVRLERFLERPASVRPRKPFVFGTTASLDMRKNLHMLIYAFAKEFGDSTDVKLKINTRSDYNVDLIKSIIAFYDLTNVEFTHHALNNDSYVEFMDGFDCYVNISKGEGFSIGPREALALGLPCILTDNSAQKTICNQNIVRPVPSSIEEPTNYYGSFGGEVVGLWWDCYVEDVQFAMRDVYENYENYLEKAEIGKIWVNNYLWKNLKLKYLNLIKPKKIILGEKNEITDDYLMTNSEKLYFKYIK